MYYYKHMCEFNYILTLKDNIFSPKYVFIYSILNYSFCRDVFIDILLFYALRYTNIFEVG